MSLERLKVATVAFRKYTAFLPHYTAADMTAMGGEAGTPGHKDNSSLLVLKSCPVAQNKGVGNLGG